MIKIFVFLFGFLFSFNANSSNSTPVYYSNVKINGMYSGYDTTHFFCIVFSNTGPSKTACLNGSLTNEKFAFNELFNIANMSFLSNRKVKVYMIENRYSSNDNSGLSRSVLTGISTCNSKTCL